LLGYVREKDRQQLALAPNPFQKWMSHGGFKHRQCTVID
jgi:hypothetical protein